MDMRFWSRQCAKSARLFVGQPCRYPCCIWRRMRFQDQQGHPALRNDRQASCGYSLRLLAEAVQVARRPFEPRDAARPHSPADRAPAALPPAAHRTFRAGGPASVPGRATKESIARQAAWRRRFHWILKAQKQPRPEMRQLSAQSTKVDQD